jgi:hypothetical protein
MKTWTTMRTEIRAETNTEGEDFISDAELLTWVNEGKDMAEKEIVSLYDKYLETEADLVMTDGSEYVSLPSDIFANKITGIFYDNGDTSYEVKLLKDKRETLEVGEEDDYRFRFDNSTASGVRIKLYPEARESSTGNLTCFYIRESAAIDSDSDTVDIPIADSFIKQYIKDKIKEKEVGPMNVTGPSPALQRERDLLIEALNHMVPSESADEMDLDTSFYDDMDVDPLGE